MKVTYKDIQEAIKNEYGYTPKTCWIADAKGRFGLPIKQAHNRKGVHRRYPCPKNKIPHFRQVFKNLGLI